MNCLYESKASETRVDGWAGGTIDLDDRLRSLLCGLPLIKATHCSRHAAFHDQVSPWRELLNAISFKRQNRDSDIRW